ncbi:MAG: SpoIVB peptidase [Eubacteriales bacterium]|nr:SpoIVB peptidase [Eubacteriales bacterium]
MLTGVAFIFRLIKKVTTMLFRKKKKLRLPAIIVSLFILTIMAIYINAYFVIPGEITLIRGEEHIFHFKSILPINIEADREGMLSVNGGVLGGESRFLDFSGQVSFKSKQDGSVKLNMKVLGFMPFRTMTVDIVENQMLVPCGNTVGVKLKLKGVLVVGISDVNLSEDKVATPARDAGLKSGDLILQINDKDVRTISSLIDHIENSEGEVLKVLYTRGEKTYETTVTPQKAYDDKQYHIGMWVRDNTAGIGTLTFYDPNTKTFAALGHGITDVDTGILMPSNSGEILESSIIEVKKGEKGVPGELKGIFVESRNPLGKVEFNCEQGIYGKLSEGIVSSLPSKSYNIGVRAQVRQGQASILANISGKRIEEYNIEIVKINNQNTNGSKGMVISITDERLLSSTGGIVQGMSGSPILQDGRIIGAVTHVLVNDPTRGYGIFIESMIKNILKVNDEALKKAS